MNEWVSSGWVTHSQSWDAQSLSRVARQNSSLTPATNAPVSEWYLPSLASSSMEDADDGEDGEDEEEDGEDEEDEETADTRRGGSAGGGSDHRCGWLCAERLTQLSEGGDGAKVAGESRSGGAWHPHPGFPVRAGAIPCRILPTVPAASLMQYLWAASASGLASTISPEGPR